MINEDEFYEPSRNSMGLYSSTTRSDSEPEIRDDSLYSALITRRSTEDDSSELWNSNISRLMGSSLGEEDGKYVRGLLTPFQATVSIIKCAIGAGKNPSSSHHDFFLIVGSFSLPYAFKQVCYLMLF